MIATAPFGSTGHESTRTIFGAAALGSISQAEADPTLDLLLEHGVNHIDVAASYGDAELRLAPWLAGSGRQRFFLATKTGRRDTREPARRSAARSSGMGVDHVDLIQLHNLVDVIEWEEALREGGALEALVEARDEGLARFIGVTGHGLTVAAYAPAQPRTVSVRHGSPAVQRHPDARCAVCRGVRSARPALRRARRRDADDQGITLAPWNGRTQTTSTWYEPLREQDDIDLAVHYVLARPGVFLNTASDVELLPLVLDAASRFEHAPPQEAVDDLIERRRLVALF